MEQYEKRTWAEIRLDNIVYNMKAIRASLPAGTKFLGVVKANAYGHGAVQVSRALEENGADYLAVACLDEALELRQGGITLPILILGQTPAEYVPVLIRENVTQAVTDKASALAFDAAAERCGGKLKIHIKVDTGMSRLGFICSGDHLETGVQDAAAACRCAHLVPEGIFTHFAKSDMPGEAAEAYTREQFRLFNAMIDGLAAEGIRFAVRHCSATGGTLNYAKEMALDMVRPGLLLYGYGDEGKLGLKPCMSVFSHMSTIKVYDPGISVSYGGTYVTERQTRMGVVPMGYADGLFRSISNKAAFYVAGGMAPQRGRVCMDMCMIDLTDLPAADPDSVVEIFGEHASLDTLSEAAGTIPYELMCAVSRRVPRVYR